MRKISAILITLGVLINLQAQAESATFEVKGMKCGECVKSIEAKVCALKGVEKCQVELGKVVLTSKAGQKIDISEAKKEIEGAGHFTVKKSTQQN